MTLRAEIDPDQTLLQAIADTAPRNPFHTPAFVAARALRGWSPVGFLASTDDDAGGCVAFLIQGRIHRDLRVESAPDVERHHPLWNAIRDFCRRHHVTRLQVQSFGSARAEIPSLARETLRQQRREYVLDLGPECPPLKLSSNHRRNLRRAEQAGVAVVETADPEAGRTHSALIDLSMIRRQERGESVSADSPAATVRHFLETGAGVLFQARSTEHTTLSSVLVLRSRRGAYYHSAGTSPEGMAQGASQLLIATIAERLRDRGITQFNLGGAGEDQAGLARFKNGFGPRTVELEAASFDVSTGHRRILIKVADRLRSMLRS